MNLEILTKYSYILSFNEWGNREKKWAKDELECHIEQGYQLKCDHNTEIVGSNTIRCNIDQGPLSSEITFECNVDGNCQVRRIRRL